MTDMTNWHQISEIATQIGKRYKFSKVSVSFENDSENKICWKKLGSGKNDILYLDLPPSMKDIPLIDLKEKITTYIELIDLKYHSCEWNVI